MFSRATSFAFVLCACGSVPPSSPNAAPPAAPAAVPPPAGELAGVAAPAASAPEPLSSPVDLRTARIFRLCRLWAEARYEHPWVVAGAIDWDAALVAALPKTLAATSDDEEVAAVRTLLEALHDPLSRIEHPSPSPSAPTGAAAPRTVHTTDGVTVIPVALSNWSEMESTGERVARELARSKLAVVDLRTASQEEAWLQAMTLEQAASHIASHDGTAIAKRVVEHRGYRPQRGSTSGDYETMWASSLPTAYTATKGPHPSRVVFLANAVDALPDVAWAMQRAGDAIVVIQREAGGGAIGWADAIPFPGGYVAHVRLADVLGAPLIPDVELAPSMPEAKVEKVAVDAARRPPSRNRLPKTSPIERSLAWHPDATFVEETHPSREHRLLALFRFWGVIHYFYPYLPLMGDTWDEAFADFLPRFEAAGDAREYALAVAELAARIPDGHVRVSGSAALEQMIGAGRAPFGVQIVEGQVVVTNVLDDTGVAVVGLTVGDVIAAVDGEPVAARMARVSKYTAGSNDVARATRSADVALRGDLTARLALKVRGKNGELRDVVVARKKEPSLSERTGPVFRLLDGEIGYADLDRLEGKDVDAMFAAFEKSPAIVFDMRGYPHGTAWSIGPRLNVRKAKFAAEFFEPLVSPGEMTSTFFAQRIGMTDKPLYRGKTVMLIDERTISQAEHTGLFLETANGTTFIGSQTAGANGDVTELSLPGGLYVRFSGHDVRHADGRQLQRVGLVPAIEVRPTIEGLRAGRDEVLERALAFLQSGK